MLSRTMHVVMDDGGIDEARSKVLAQTSAILQSKVPDHIMFGGAENTNVFVGAYSAWVERIGTEPVHMRLIRL